MTVVGTGGRVRANREQLDAAVSNLVDNALRHGRSAHIEIRLWTELHETGLDVTDDGAGIPPEHLGKIFERFYTTNRAGGGTGLGLALVRAVAQAHSGRVEVESAPGRTRFRIALPKLQSNA